MRTTSSYINSHCSLWENFVAKLVWKCFCFVLFTSCFASKLNEHRLWKGQNLCSRDLKRGRHPIVKHKSADWFVSCVSHLLSSFVNKRRKWRVWKPRRCPGKYKAYKQQCISPLLVPLASFPNLFIWERNKKTFESWRKFYSDDRFVLVYLRALGSFFLHVLVV